MAMAMSAGIIIPAVAVMAAPAIKASGWVKTGGTWNYLKNRAKVAGWVKDGATWYFMNARGTMQTGWIQDAST